MFSDPVCGRRKPVAVVSHLAHLPDESIFRRARNGVHQLVAPVSHVQSEARFRTIVVGGVKNETQTIPDGDEGAEPQVVPQGPREAAENNGQAEACQETDPSPERDTVGIKQVEQPGSENHGRGRVQQKQQGSAGAGDNAFHRPGPLALHYLS